MAVVAFFLNQSPASGEWWDSDVSARIIGALMSLPGHEPSTRALVKSGGLLLHRFAYRLVEVKEVRESRGRVSISHGHRARQTVWKFLLANFAESRGRLWHAGDSHAIDQALSQTGVEVFSVGPISLSVANRIHAVLMGVDGYLGSAEVDLGHPILFKVLWSGLFQRYQVVGTELGFVDTWEAAKEDRWPLDEPDDGWWHHVGASDVYWTREDDGGHPHPEKVVAQPNSWHGDRTLARLDRLRMPTTMEKVASALSAHPGALPRATRSFTAELLPTAEDVIIPESKLREYALNLSHPVGGPKAIKFRDLLGIYADDWRFLSEQIRRGVRAAPAVQNIRSDDHGVRFDVITAVKGRNNTILPVVSGWIVLPGRPPSLATVFVAKANVELNPSMSPQDVPILPLERKGDWQLLWSIARAAANEAAELAVADPIYVTGDSSAGTWVTSGSYGMGAVRVFDARKGFARWLRKAGHGSAGHLSGTWLFSPERNLDGATSWARTFADVLEWHGIRSEVHTFEL